ncbi:MAG: hypothetical protein IPN44_13100 [Flavobacteriales bacterium]|nr:hypothetical protein [Flavobacteriales bacterium]
MKQETFEVDVTSKEAKALLKQLQALGVISLRPKKVRGLAEVVKDIQTRAANFHRSPKRRSWPR